MNRDVRPYRCPDPALVQLGPWQMEESGEWMPLPEALPDWDSLTDLNLGRDARIDVPAALRQAMLPTDTPLLLVVEWRASTSGLCGLGAKTPLHQEGQMRIESRLRGRDLSGILSLATRLVLGADVEDTATPYTARRMGEVLYEEFSECRLQGAASMFPISVVDFAAMRIPAEARWHLVVPTDLAQPVMGGLRLYLNANDQELIAAAQSAGKASAQQRQLLTFLRLDITRQLVDIALTGEHVYDLDEYDDQTDSFGGMLRQLLRDLFGDEPPKVLAAQCEAQPNVFATGLQAAALRAQAGDL